MVWIINKWTLEILGGNIKIWNIGWNHPKNTFLGLSILAEIIKKIASWDYQTIYKQRTTIYMLWRNTSSVYFTGPWPLPQSSQKGRARTKLMLARDRLWAVAKMNGWELETKKNTYTSGEYTCKLPHSHDPWPIKECSTGPWPLPPELNQLSLHAR